VDINDIRIAWTLASIAVFAAIVAWAWSRGARSGFEEAAQLPFMDEPRPRDLARGNGEGLA
jgi:cytochrome c oxidase cbb3-type subunit 4